jgi:hypothetical protein
MKNDIPFPTRGIDSDNGGEFIVKLPSGRCKKIYGKPKTPAQRLLETPGVPDSVKERLQGENGGTLG